MRQNPNAIGGVADRVSFERVLSGMRYSGRFYPVNHLVLDRIGQSIQSGSSEIRIVPVGDGVRVDFGDTIGRVFPSIRNLNVVDGKPLYIADLPADETNYWVGETVVYGTSEYYGPEGITHVFGVIGGDPIFTGWLVKDGMQYYFVVHGRRHMLAFNKLSAKTDVFSGMLVYAGTVSEYDCEPYEWYAVVGATMYGPYDVEPTIRDTYSPLESGGRKIDRIVVSGLRNGRQRRRLIHIPRADLTVSPESTAPMSIS